MGHPNALGGFKGLKKHDIPTTCIFNQLPPCLVSLYLYATIYFPFKLRYSSFTAMTNSILTDKKFTLILVGKKFNTHHL